MYAKRKLRGCRTDVYRKQTVHAVSMNPMMVRQSGKKGKSVATGKVKKVKKARTSIPPPHTDSDGEAAAAVVDQPQGPQSPAAKGPDEAPESPDDQGNEGPGSQAHEGPEQASDVQHIGCPLGIFLHTLDILQTSQIHAFCPF